MCHGICSFFVCADYPDLYFYIRRCCMPKINVCHESRCATSIVSVVDRSFFGMQYGHTTELNQA
jgi:hypothetical protein